MNLEKFIEKATPIGLTDVIVMQNGKQLAKYHMEGDYRRNIYSASKSFTSAAVGIAEAEGLLSLEERVVDAFAADLPDKYDKKLERVTIRDLLTMCTGHDKAYLMADDRVSYGNIDWVKYVLEQPLPYEPNTVFAYDNTGPYLAGVLVQRRSGASLIEYLYPRLFEPLGMTRTVWEIDPQGRNFGAGGLFLAPTELAKFGELLLNHGMHNGKQLIPRDWLERATKKQVENGEDGYGYLFWQGDKGSYRADGRYGYFVIVLEDKNAVITVCAESRCQGKLLECIFETIYPLL